MGGLWDRLRTDGVWHGRATLGMVVALCMVVTTLAVTGAGSSSAGLRFVQYGHFVYNSTLKTVFHIDGATKSATPVVELPAGPGTVVAQTDQSGYALSTGNILEFGKSDLQVKEPEPVPSAEAPIVLEAAGAAFAVYRNAGVVQRLGKDRAALDVDALGQPVVTSTGTLWLHIRGTGRLCQLPMATKELVCAASVPPGHTGSLSLVGDQVVFVDTTAKLMRTVGSDGFGKTVWLPHVGLTGSSVVAGNDVAGRLAVLNPERRELALVETGALATGGEAPAPVVRSLPPGRYSQLASSGQGLALIDENTNAVVALNRDGQVRSQRRLPGPGPIAGRKAAIFHGTDSRVYVSTAAGDHVLVMEGEGEVSEVPVEPPAGEGEKPVDQPTRQPTPQRTEPVRPSQPVRPSVPVTTERRPGAQPTGRRTTAPPRTEPAETPRRTQPPEPERTTPSRRPRTTQPTTPKPPAPKPTPTKPTVRAGRPGAPGLVRASAGNASAEISWRAAPANGATITSYQVSWPGGSRTVPGTSRRLDVSGLRNGQSYAFTVRAVNSVGSGPGTTSARVTPQAPTPSIVISRGPRYENDPDICAPRNCYYIHIVARNLKPLTSYTFQGHTTNYGELHKEGGDQLRTDANGRITVDKFYNDDVDGQIWVTVTGQGRTYTSNRVRW